MSISKGAVIKLILKYIGGSPLMQVPTSTIGGSPIAAQVGGLVGAAAGAAAAVSAAASAAGAAGLSAGMALLSKNPLAEVIESASGKIDELTTNGFAALDTKLSDIASNPALETQYNKLKLALGGPDGLSGASAQIKKFKEHTDRLSGLLPSSDSTGE